MPSNKIKILNVIPTFYFNGGIQHYVYDLLKNMDKTNLDLHVVGFDWNTDNKDTNASNSLESNFNKYGITTHNLPNPNVSLFKFSNDLKTLFKNNDYDIVHVHTLGVAFIILLLAKKANIQCRIFHAHETKYSDKILHRIRNTPLVFLSRIIATNYAAVSNEAGKAFFKKKKFDVIHPCIDYLDYKYCKKDGINTRNALGINSKTFVIGAAGRFCKAKNLEFAVKVFDKFNKVYKDSVLVLWGSGEKKNKYEKLIKKFKLDECVIMPGVSDNLCGCYSACDIFVFPSLHEGFGLVAVQAQCNGLLTLVSNKVAKNCDVGSCKFLPLRTQEWVNVLKKETKSRNRHNNFDIHDFDCNDNAERLKKFYIRYGQHNKD